MARGDAFDEFYRESHDRLLQQVYAYCGVLEVAQRALTDAYVSAAQHWHTVSTMADKDAWVRVHALKATARRRNRSREPWYVSARGTADENRRLLAILGETPSAERHLFLAATLAGLDHDAAAREARFAPAETPSSISRTSQRLQEAGLGGSPAEVRTALDALRGDLRHDPVEPARRVQRDGDRRRHSYQVLGGAVAAAVAVVAVVWLSTSGDDSNVPASAGPTTTPGRTSTTTTSQAPPAPEVGRTELATATSLAGLAGRRAWSIVSTSADLGVTAPPPDPCLSDLPDSSTTDHYWVRQFSPGKARRARTGGAGTIHARRTSATQVLEVDASRSTAQQSYAAQVTAFGGCQAGAHRLLEVKKVHGVADLATALDLQYVDRTGLHGELVTIARSADVVATWIVREPATPAPSTRPVVGLLASSVKEVCRLAHGSCPDRPYRATPTPPPPDEAAPGFLSTVDLPLFSDVAKPWVATAPAPTRDNPAATACDQADFAGGGAADVASRSFVIPGSRSLPDSFGMSETVGTFASRKAADDFVDTVATAVSGCSDQNPTLTVDSTSDITPDRGSGVVWSIDLATSSKTSLAYRVALVRVGSSVAQVTFTPSGAADLSPTAYGVLAERAALRLEEL